MEEKMRALLAAVAAAIALVGTADTSGLVPPVCEVQVPAFVVNDVPWLPQFTASHDVGISNNTSAHDAPPMPSWLSPVIRGGSGDEPLKPSSPPL